MKSFTLVTEGSPTKPTRIVNMYLPSFNTPSRHDFTVGTETTLHDCANIGCSSISTVTRSKPSTFSLANFSN